jgi:hypothetical protein
MSQPKERTPALTDSAICQQRWDALVSKLIEATKDEMVYTQEVVGSSPAPPILMR